MISKKAILFDLDNTLYDYDAPHEKALKAVFKEFKKYIDLPYKKFIKLYFLSREEIQRELSGTASSHNRILYFQRLIEKTKNTVDPKIILKLYNTYWDTLLKNMIISKESIRTLKELKRRGMRIAVVSDLTTEIQLKKLSKLKLSGLVDVLVTSEEAGSDKPHAIMFLLALNKLRVTPTEAMMVGDNTIADIEGANFVGLDTILLKKGKLSRTFEEDYKQPKFTIKKLDELLPIVDSFQ